MEVALVTPFLKLLPVQNALKLNFVKKKEDNDILV
jgi:hypothetical protein